MNKPFVALTLASTLLLPAIAWAGPNEDLAKGMAQGKSVLVEQAILQGANPNYVTKTMRLPVIIWALRWNNFKLVKLLVAKGADVNVQDANGLTPVIIAVVMKQPSVLKFLIDKGADPKRNKYGEDSPLSMASSLGELESFKILLAHGADFRERSYAFLLASGCKDGNPEVEEKTMLKSRIEVIRVLLVKNGLHQENKPVYQRALHCAAVHGYQEIVYLLLENGVDPNSLGEGGKGVLFFVTENVYINNELTLLKMLLDKGANPNTKSAAGETILMRAVVGGNLDSVKLLLQKGADLTIKNNEGKTAVDYAKEYNQKEVLEYLEKL